MNRLAAFALVLLSASAWSAPSPCVISAYDQVDACKNSTDIVLDGPFTVPPEKVINLSKLSNYTRVTVNGVITFAHSTSLNSTNWLFTLGGNFITFDGSNGTFYGSGPEYWDTLGANGGVPKPKFFRLQGSFNVVSGLTLVNSPVHVFSVNGNNHILDGIKLDNSAGDVIPENNNMTLGHNTDAFDVSANNILIQNAYIRNQDDCLAINTGRNITFRNNTCIGGHGISIGSIKTDKFVDSVLVDNCTIVDSENGIRIKTVFNATNAAVTNVVYQNIILSNITNYGIVIRQDYLNTGPTGTPTAGILVSNITLINVRGTMGNASREGTFVLCANCSNFDFRDINITPYSASCIGITPLPESCASEVPVPSVVPSGSIPSEPTRPEPSSSPSPVVPSPSATPAPGRNSEAPRMSVASDGLMWAVFIGSCIASMVM